MLSEGKSMKQNSNYSLAIEAGRTERHYWSDLWRYRELFYFLLFKDKGQIVAMRMQTQ